MLLQSPAALLREGRAALDSDEEDVRARRAQGHAGYNLSLHQVRRVLGTEVAPPARRVHHREEAAAHQGHPAAAQRALSGEKLLFSQDQVPQHGLSRVPATEEDDAQLGGTPVLPW